MPAARATNAGHFVRAQLAGQRFADVRWVAETGSTNSDVMALARDGAAEGTVVVADHQRRGRGRQGRSWLAPPGSSLLVSVLLRPAAPVAGTTAMAAGVAMADAIETVAGCVPRLKWPNDLVLPGPDRGQSGHSGAERSSDAGSDGPDRSGQPEGSGDRKVGGILAEADWPPGTSESGGWRDPAPHERLAVVVGVGVNVNWPAALPTELVDNATALNHVVGRTVDRAELLVAFLRRLDDCYGQMAQDGSTASIVEAWRRRSATLGRRVRVDLGAEDVEGTAVEVTDQGHLVVETLDGNRRTLAVGDVVHLRPASREKDASTAEG